VKEGGKDENSMSAKQAQEFIEKLQKSWFEDAKGGNQKEDVLSRVVSECLVLEGVLGGLDRRTEG
jgi:hypothetical protein